MGWNQHSDWAACDALAEISWLQASVINLLHCGDKRCPSEYSTGRPPNTHLVSNTTPWEGFFIALLGCRVDQGAKLIDSLVTSQLCFTQQFSNSSNY